MVAVFIQVQPLPCAHGELTLPHWYIQAGAHQRRLHNTSIVYGASLPLPCSHNAGKAQHDEHGGWEPKVRDDSNLSRARSVCLPQASKYLNMGWHVIRALVSMAIMGTFWSDAIK